MADTYHVGGDGWIVESVRVAREHGWSEVEGISNTSVPGLAVTMVDFGLFCVTHRESGRSMGAYHERAGTAAAEMMRWFAISQTYDFTWNAGPDEVRVLADAVQDSPVPFPDATLTESGETRRMTVGEWVRFIKSPYRIEFPWEEKSPWDEAADLLSSFGSPPR